CIESPMVGTFYSSSAPDAPPFVTAGSTVRPDSTVCVIEAMKVFTDIPAGLAGTITEILVKNGQPVEYGQPLFRLTPQE
ncbi:MAG: biotin/lipoyl-binding protein, partial [Planctomycetes bacterium]|nr:biotin/lipoyl-binding protein [Planctomycetota bacterium]